MRVLHPETKAQGRVALLIPRWTDRAQVEPQGVPFRSFSMGGAFLAAGFELVFFDQEHDQHRVDRVDELLGELTGARAAFVWMNESYPSNQFRNAMELTRRIKSVLPELPVVVGGEMVTICPAEFFDLRTPNDYFLRGYGEDAALRLLDHLDACTEPTDVSGLIWRNPDGDLERNPITARASFETSFLALYHELDLTPYIQTGGVFGNDQPTLSVAPGRGCTKGCAFCCWSNHPAKILDGDETFMLLCALQERYGVNQFHIGELDFFVSRSRALRLAERIANERPELVWFALGSPIDLIGLSPDEWDQLQRGGLRKLELGSESGSDRVLRAIGKKHTGADILTVSKHLLDRGIVAMNNFLFGFPEETHADRAATLQLIDRLLAIGTDCNHITYRHYQPIWGTGLGDVALARDFSRAREVQDWLADRPLFDDERRRTMPWVQPEDERELKRLINFDLPLATSQLELRSPWRQAVYRALRSRARRSLRDGGNHRRIDRWLYDRVVARELDCTFIP